MRVRAFLTLVSVLIIGLAGCGSSQPASPGSSPGVTAYVHCLAQHTSAGARKACRSLRPAGGLAGVLPSLTDCLRAHGVSVPAPSGGPHGKTVWQFLAGLRTGGPAQRSAFQSCVAGPVHG